MIEKLTDETLKKVMQMSGQNDPALLASACIGAVQNKLNEIIDELYEINAKIEKMPEM